jgi:hypothetical protein
MFERQDLRRESSNGMQGKGAAIGLCVAPQVVFSFRNDSLFVVNVIPADP